MSTVGARLNPVTPLKRSAKGFVAFEPNRIGHAPDRLIRQAQSFASFAQSQIFHKRRGCLAKDILKSASEVARTQRCSTGEYLYR